MGEATPCGTRNACADTDPLAQVEKATRRCFFSWSCRTTKAYRAFAAAAFFFEELASLTVASKEMD